METLLVARLLIALIGTGAATWYDIFNKKNVPDKLLYTFLAVAVIINIFDYSQLIARLPLVALILIFLYIMYRAGQLGGADIMVLAGIYYSLPAMTSPLLAASPLVTEMLPLPSILSILAVSTVLCALWIVLKLGPRLLDDTLKGKIKFKMLNVVVAVVMLVVYGFLLMTMLQLSAFLTFSVMHIIFLTVIVILVFIFSLYKDAIMESMVVWKRRVEPEEVLSLELLPVSLVKKLHLNRLVTVQQMRKMNRINRKWPVLDLPAFLPCILIALVIYVLFGDSMLFFS
ncbi:MAG: hypothetical protein QW112_00075 [Candidatus Micrarchaeia archaeon]